MGDTHQRQDECRQCERRQTQRAWVGNLTQTRVDRSWGRIFVVVDARALFDVVVEGRHEWLVCGVDWRVLLDPGRGRGENK
jgi:hypothetical protein